MRLIKNKYYSFPGLYPIRKSKAYLISDSVFFLLFAALPTSFFALVPQQVFYEPGLYDLNLIFFLSGLVYLLFYFNHLPKIWRIPSGRYFIYLCAYLVLQVVYSYLYKEIPLKEIITIFRKNFFWPIATLGFLLYVASMSSYRIERMFRWIFVITLFMGMLYIFSNLTGIDVWGARVKEGVQFEGVILLQNTYAIPKYLHILFVFAFIASITDDNFRNYWMWVTGLVVTVLSFVRNQIIVYAMYMFFSYVLAKSSGIRTYFGKTIKQLVLLFAAVFLLVTAFPMHVDRLVHKFGFYDPTISRLNYSIEGLNTATYDFRVHLIDEAYSRTIESNIVFGNGYIRESTPGSYDFVLGSDSFVPAVLYTEGIFGLFMRWLPLFVLLYYGFRYISKGWTPLRLFWLVILVFILPQLINIVQTTIFTEYNRWYFVFASLLLLGNKTRNEQRSVHEVS